MTREDLADRRGVETTVYQPAEDSALLARAAVEVISSDHRVLEVGTGSGWVAEQVVNETGATVVASDLNPHACREAAERAEALKAEGQGFDVVAADLVSPFAAESFDVVLFNPPYLPTTPDNEWDDWMERALSGGESGRAVIEPFVDAVDRVLAPDGHVLMLVSSLTNYDRVMAFVHERGFATETVLQESYPYETLSIVSMSQSNKIV